MIAGAVLAAGEGRRFGGLKQLAPVADRPLLEHPVAAMTAVRRLDRVVVVLGADAPAIRAAVHFGRAEPIACEGWREGIAASLRCAVESLPGADPLVIALGDTPRLTPASVDAVLDAALSEPQAAAVRATYGGVPGHPVALRVGIHAAVLGLRGDAGAGRLLDQIGAIQVDCSHLAGGADVDTQAQLQDLKS